MTNNIKKNNITKFLFLSFLLQGCTINGFYEGYSSDTPDDILKYNDKKFLGIPFLLAFEGSSVKLNNQWRATVAHNRPLLVGQEVYYHPRCDFALIKIADEGDYPEVGFAFYEKNVFHVGYPIFGIGSSHKGEARGDVINTTDNCMYSATDGTVISGMSGGGVFNESGQLVGVTTGVMFNNLEWPDGKTELFPSVFMPLAGVEDFIYEITGIDFYPDFETVSNPLTTAEKLAIRKELEEEIRTAKK
jgi:hypothetical protein